MKISGNIQRTCLGGWLLAALCIGGINIHQFAMMENQTLSGYSQTIKMLQANLLQFNQTLADGLFSLAGQVKLPESDVSTKVAGKAVKKIPASADRHASGTQDTDTIILPSLTGIVHVVPTNGTVYFQALLNGRLCRAKDEIDGFTVDKISPKGVVVRRAGIKWTIESPTPYYSSDQGN
jgi:hypothetical protein